MPKDLPESAVVCLSGGLDSTSLLLHLLARRVDVAGVSFRYGQRHEIELARLKKNLEYLATRGLKVEWREVDLRSIQPLVSSALTDTNWEMPLGYYAAESMRETVVPNRNSIFAAIAYGFALSLANKTSRTVAMALGVHAGDHSIYPDCRPEFFEALLHAFQIGNWNSELVTQYLPYLRFTKTEILRDAIESVSRLGLDFDIVFRNTCTSYLPDESGRSHGLTGADVERILAFHEVGRIDPIEYRRPWDEVVAQAIEAQAAHQRQSTGPTR